MRKIPPFKLVPEPLNDDAKALPPFKSAGYEMGKRHQLGGEPQYIQDEDCPKCSCGNNMHFYAQIDSINDEFILGDCGMIYVFVCFDCLETQAILQSY